MPEMIRLKDFERASNPFAAAAQALREHPGATFRIDPGVYEIGTELSRETMQNVLSGAFGDNPEREMFRPDFRYDVGLPLDDLRDVTVEAEGATLLIDGFMEPLSIRRTKNLCLRGLTIDHKRKPYSCGVVSDWHAEGCGAAFTVTFLDRYPVSESIPMPRVCLFDPNANRFTCYNDFHVTARKWLGGQAFRLTADADLPFSPNGMLLYAWHTFHSRPCVFLEDSRDVRLVSVTLHSQPGMGVVAHRCENLDFDQLRVVPSAGEHMSTNTDATHITSCKGLVRYRSCFFEGQGDDSVNIHSYYHTIVEARGQACTVENRAPTGTHSQTPDLFDVGDTLELTCADSLRAVDQFRVLSRESPAFGCMRLTLDRPLPDDCVGSYLADVTRQPELIFEGNTCRNHLARSALIKVKRARVVGNAFIDVVGTAIDVAAESPWKEALCATEEIVVQGNRIVYCGRNDDIRQRDCAGVCVTVDAPHPNALTHKRVVITDNIIDCPDSPVGVYVSNTESLTLERNNINVKETPIRVVDFAPDNEDE